MPPIESRHGDEQLRRKYPLEMISAQERQQHELDVRQSPVGGFRNAKLYLNAADADARGIGASDQVRVYNDRGSCVLVAEVDDSVKPGLVSSPAVRWGKKSADKRNVNALVSQRLTDAGGGPVFYSCLVQVERIGD